MTANLDTGQQRATRFLFALDRLTPGEWRRVLAQYEAGYLTDWRVARGALDRAVAADGALGARYDEAVIDHVRFRAATIAGASGVPATELQCPRVLASYAALAVLAGTSLAPRYTDVLLAPFAHVVPRIDVECATPSWLRHEGGALIAARAG